MRCGNLQTYTKLNEQSKNNPQLLKKLRVVPFGDLPGLLPASAKGAIEVHDSLQFLQLVINPGKLCGK